MAPSTEWCWCTGCQRFPMARTATSGLAFHRRRWLDEEPLGVLGQLEGEAAHLVLPDTMERTTGAQDHRKGVHDTTFRPERLAGVGRRIGAWFLSIVLVIVTLVIDYIIWGLITWGRGQTPALQVLGMRCWRPAQNKVPGWWWMALREIIGRLADGILSFITLITSFILMVASPRRQCLHDLVAATIVAYDPKKLLAT